MDPMSLPMAFATIVSLIGLFRQERSRREDQSSQAFLEWLTAHNFQDLRDQLSESQLLLEQIDAVLRQNQDELLSRLDRIDEVLATVVGRIEGPESLAASLRPDAQLSDQAVSILRQLVNSESTEFGKIMTMSDTTLSLSHGGSITVGESRFLDDDLSTLVELELLLPRIGSRGTEFYRITRRAVQLIEAIDGEASSGPCN